MDEIQRLVLSRINKLKQLNLFLKNLENQSDNFVSFRNIQEVKKAKDEQKFRIEKENWIVNILKNIKEFTNEQKM